MVEVDACGCNFGIHYLPGDYTMIFVGENGERATIPFRILPTLNGIDF